MALDEREYIKARQGWKVENLTGCRRTAQQIANDEIADLIKASRRTVQFRWLGFVLATFAVATFLLV